MSSQPSESVPSFLPVVALLTLIRVFINTGARMIYPLLPVFARGVSVEVTAIVSVLTFIQLIGLIAPFIGRISERRGRKFTILLSLALYMMGMLVVFILPNFWGLAIALLMGALGKVAFDPAVQAYIGDRVPYQRRGMMLGIMELGWSGAFLVGVPVMTWLIANANWQAPFALLAVLMGLGLLTSAYLLEVDRSNQQRVALFQAMRSAVNSRMAVAGLVLGFAVSAANQLINVVFSTWIEDNFGIQLAALAIAAVVIGASELGGEGLVTVFADRFGKRRLVIIGILSNILACLILPLTYVDLNLAMLGLFFFYLTFELTLVSIIPLSTELSPHSRAMYLTVLVSAVTLGRALSTPLASLLFGVGLFANAFVAIGLNLVALVAIGRYINIK